MTNHPRKRSKRHPNKLLEVINDVLDASSSVCLDDDEDRDTLALRIEEALRERLDISEFDDDDDLDCEFDDDDDLDMFEGE